MALLLHIDTATEYGAVAISDNESVIAVEENNNQKEHASFLHTAIGTVVKSSGVALNKIDAVSVTIGPGSYTGLRVGLTAAKGLCYVLQKPLVAVSTLQAMALASIENIANPVFVKPVLFAPMIDARRMEVYTGLYTINLDIYSAPQAIVLNPDIFTKEIENYLVIVSGSGSKKLNSVVNDDNFLFINAMHDMKQVAAIAFKKFLKNEFENITYCEPLYLKPFYTTITVKK